MGVPWDGNPQSEVRALDFGFVEVPLAGVPVARLEAVSGSQLVRQRFRVIMSDLQGLFALQGSMFYVSGLLHNWRLPCTS